MRNFIIASIVLMTTGCSNKPDAPHNAPNLSGRAADTISKSESASQKTVVDPNAIGCSLTIDQTSPIAVGDSVEVSIATFGAPSQLRFGEQVFADIPIPILKHSG